MLARRQELRSSWPLDVRLDELQADLAASWSVRLASPMSPHHETVGVVPPGLVGVGVALDEAAEIAPSALCVRVFTSVGTCIKCQVDPRRKTYDRSV